MARVPPPSSSSPSPSSRRSQAPARPTSFGNFEVIAKIAGGGLSTIYLARPAGGGEPVAVKVVKRELLEDPRVTDMFLDEARLLARLVHPNVVRTLDVSVEGDQRYIAMELLLGVTVAKLQEEAIARKSRLEHELVAWIGARVADALAYAHGLGAIHRDVNPRNVLVTFDGEVKLFDFGLAKTEGDRNAQSSPGLVKGTLPYVSPEQIMQMPLDGRSDVFGLGTSLWEMLTAQRLFRRDTDHETLRAVHCGPIPDVRQHASDVPAELSAIVAKALVRNRDNRYASAADMARDLDGFVRARGLAAPADRLAKLLAAIFPDERKKQRGWLKPPVSAR
jgi:serine/threonine-protein kinase